MMAAVDPKVFIRMGTHAEKDYFEKTLKFFDGIALGANLVEATPGATASLMVRFGGKKVRLPYYIDPMTYAYGAYRDNADKLRSDLDWIKSEQKRKGRKPVRDFKRSYRGLAQALGPPFTTALERKSAVTWDDLSSAKAINDCCQNVANYQLNRIATELAGDPELGKFTKEIPRSAAVIAPYFYIEHSKQKEWLDLNIRLATAAVRLKPDVPVHATLCADASFLGDSSFLDEIKAKLPKTGVDGVWLWFSAFRENAADAEELAGFRSLVEDLSASMEVYNRHGGYFSLAMCKYGMSGISHGVGYGEQKDVLPVIGQSTPTVRYYLPNVHRRFGVPQIERCFDELKIHTADDFYKKVCNCVICKGIVSDELSAFSAFGDMHWSNPESKRKAQTPAAAKRCRFHFLISRVRERDWLKDASVSDIVKELEKATRVWGKQPSLRGELDYLTTWKEALE